MEVGFRSHEGDVHLLETGASGGGSSIEVIGGENVLGGRTVEGERRFAVGGGGIHIEVGAQSFLWR